MISVAVLEVFVTQDWAVPGCEFGREGVIGFGSSRESTALGLNGIKLVALKPAYTFFPVITAVNTL